MESNRAAHDEGWEYFPAPPETHAYTHLGDFTVDGETFTVRMRDVDGSFHYDWISGPNDDYGFSTSGPGDRVSEDHHVASIRGFLAEINPETGYLS